MEVELDFLADLLPEPKEETARDTIIRRLSDGEVVPIIGNAFMNTLAIGNHDAIVSGWARYTNYPMADQGHSLERVAQYTAVRQAGAGAGDEMRIKERYIEFLKAALQAKARRDGAIPGSKREEVASEARTLTVSEIARRFNYPGIDPAADNPLRTLAGLPLPIYITTSYHDFLKVALESVGKKPHIEVFRWRDGLESIPTLFAPGSTYNPNPQHPLVYHLFGFDRWPASLVLTEDDYLDFLANIFKDGRILPPCVRRALTEASLVLIGYRPHDWDFRTLFRGIIAPRPFSTIKTSVAIQVEQSERNMQEYLEKYMGQARFAIEWCDPREFIRVIYQGWEVR
jgi:hypothetical protein